MFFLSKDPEVRLQLTTMAYCVILGDSARTVASKFAHPPSTYQPATPPSMLHQGEHIFFIPIFLFLKFNQNIFYVDINNKERKNSPQLLA